MKMLASSRDGRHAMPRYCDAQVSEATFKLFKTLVHIRGVGHCKHGRNEAAIPVT
jgi:hypothetical protein